MEEELVYRKPDQYLVTMYPQILNDAWVVNLRGTKNEVNREADRGQQDQSGTGMRSLVVMQDVPGRKSRQRRKTRDSNKSNESI